MFLDCAPSTSRLADVVFLGRSSSSQGTAADSPTTTSSASARSPSRSPCLEVPFSRPLQRRHGTDPSTTRTERLRLLAFLLLFCMTPYVRARSAVSAKCYFFGPGTTIHGADYRRDYGLSRKECAENCKTDVCCMGFEYLNQRCTLKSRSLNGTISPLPDAYFGLCLDFDEEERDRFWDHELGGPVLARKSGVNKEACMELCGFQEDAIIYSWKTVDEQKPDASGECDCIGVLHSVRLSFGSAAGFLI